DVKFSFERYRGASATLLKSKVKEVQAVSPSQVRIVLKEPWPDFMTFYGTTATGAGWIVPKKYVEKLGEDGFLKAPVGAGPYKVVSLKPGVELVLEAFEGYWRKAPSVKRLVMRSIVDEATRAAALRAGGVDSAYLVTGPTAESIQKLSGYKVVAPLLSGAFWLELPDQWDPKSPWAERRVRLAASHAIDRPAGNKDEPLGFSRPPGSPLSARPPRPPPTIPTARRSSWPRPATPTASTAASSTRSRPTTPWARPSRGISRRWASVRARGSWSARPTSRPGARRSSRA